jgi:hypothetical protein
MPLSRKSALRMFARWPGDAIQLSTIAAGVASCIVPRAMFSPRRYPALGGR